MNKIAERVVDAGALTCGGSFLFGVSVSNISALLQCGAFIVAMISGMCAAFYYVRKAA